MPVSKKESSITIEVHVQPKSSRDEIIGAEGERIKVKVTAPPQDGKANERVREIIAKRLEISKSNVEIIRGEKSRIKIVRIWDVSQDEYDSFVKSFRSS